MRTIEYKIGTKTTVYNFLKGSEGFSSRLITSLRKAENGILVNGLHAKTIDILNIGDTLTVNLPDGKTEIPPTKLPLKIIYEDEDVLIVDKPPFMVCHPTRNHQGDTLANAVAFYLEQQGKKCTFRAINRLDRDTTGLVVIALNRLCADRLANNIEKTYYALVCGIIESNGTIDLPIERIDEKSILRKVGENGQRAVTHYKVLKVGESTTYLEIALETGRTHQIRVHFSAVGHPLVGDTMYGTASDDIAHQCLHCGKISFEQPITKKKICVSSPNPFENIIGR